MPITKLGMKFNGKKRNTKKIYLKNYFLSLNVLRYKKELKFNKETLRYEYVEVDKLVNKVININVREKRILDFESDLVTFNENDLKVTILKFDNFETEIVNMPIKDFIELKLPEYELLLMQE
jgi:hypothetical protein